MTNPTEIIRCLKYDGYTAAEGARYCRTIARNASFNPWADPADHSNYEEAARRLEAEAQTLETAEN